MPTTKPGSGVKPFETFLDESERGWNGIYGLPNTYRIDSEGREVPVDAERAMSGDLDDSPPDRPNAAPGNSSPTKPL